MNLETALEIVAEYGDGDRLEGLKRHIDPIWIEEAIDLLRDRSDVLIASPLPGPPAADGQLRSQTLEREPFSSPAFRAHRVSTRIMLVTLLGNFAVASRNKRLPRL